MIGGFTLFHRYLTAWVDRGYGIKTTAHYSIVRARFVCEEMDQI